MKRFLSLLVCLSVVLTLGTIVFAKEDEELAEAITKVKSVVEISDEYEDFNYDKFDDEYGSRWVLSWNGENGFLSASVDCKTKDLISFDRYDYDYGNSVWTEMTESEAREIAEAFVKKANPSLASVMLFEDSNRYAGNIELNYRQSFSGYKIYYKNVNISVDGNKKRVSSYSFDRIKINKFDSADGFITEEEAKEAYKNEFGAKLVYRYDYDSDNKTIIPYLVYAIDTDYESAIDAKTGKAVKYRTYEPYDGEEVYNMARSEMLDESAGKGMAYSPEEEEAISSVENAITAQEAGKAVANAFGVSSLTLKNSHLSKEYYGERYVWTLTLGNAKSTEYVYARVDAVTAEIIQYSRYSDTKQKTKTKIDEKQAAEIFDKFVNKYAADRVAHAGETKVIKEKYGQDEVYSVSKCRIENGIEADYDSIYAQITLSGKIQEYSMSFTDGIEFEKPENIISADEAHEKAVSLGGFGIIYVLSGDKYIPVYDLKEKYFEIDPFTGNERKYIEQVEEYNDLEGHWVKGTVEKLMENGYFLAGESFKPDEKITTSEFLALSHFIYDDSDAMKEKYIAKIKKALPQIGEITKDGELTRKQAAMIFVYEMNNTDIAKHGEIFKNPFKDVENDEYKGFVALCTIKGIFSANNAGLFCPDRAMTRAEAAQTVYGYLTNK